MLTNRALHISAPPDGLPTLILDECTVALSGLAGNLFPSGPTFSWPSDFVYRH